VARALALAANLANGSGESCVQPSHLFQALLEEEEGRAAVVLVRAGLSLDSVKSLFNTPVPGLNAGVSLVPSPALQHALDRAGDLAVNSSDERTVASDHIVLALLREDEPLRQRLLKLGLSISKLESDIGAADRKALPLDEPLHLAEPFEQIATSRILDASANRAREALRVIEDYCRFTLDDAFLAGELKKMRHDLTERLSACPPGQLLEARETLRDVGTNLTTDREQQRFSLEEVVRANLKRLQEALRSLEEYGKLHSPVVGQSFEALRYRSYTLERAILLGTTARQRLGAARLYVLVSTTACVANLEWTIEEAIQGGADVIQLREKNRTDRELLERARKVRNLTRRSGVLFIMNDRADLARLSGADGVHLGQDEMPVKEARQILGPNALVGVSTHNLDQVRQAVLDGASYLGLGPIFPSGTKEFVEFPGLEFVRQTMATTTLPAYVIGGVNLDTIDAVLAAGARRIAVSQAICQSDDPQASARILAAKLKGT
jgi:thiamine-phosphate pyrophosphorylase